jgi:replicative DNA helicase Mcm
LDAAEIINKMHCFFQDYYNEEVEKMRAEMQKSIEVNHATLSKYDPELAQMVLEEPDEILRAGEVAITSIAYGERVYEGGMVDLALVNQVNQVNRVFQVNHNLTFPDYLSNSSQKILYLISLTKAASQKEVADFLKLSKQVVNQIFSRPDRGTGLVNQCMVDLEVDQEWLTLADKENREQFYKITEAGRAYLQRLADNWNSRYEAPAPDKQNFSLRFFNLPASSHVSICDVRVEHLNKMIVVEAVIRNKTAILPRAAVTRYECPSCGNVLSILQVDPVHYHEPSRCSCGRRGHFRLIKTHFKDTQKLTIEDPHSNINLGKEIMRLRGVLQDDLCSLAKQPGLKVSNRVLFTVIPRELQKEDRGVKSVDYDIYLEVNHFKNLDDTEVRITGQDEENIKSYALEQGFNVLNNLAGRFAPNIVGNDHIKQALILQQASKDMRGYKYRLRVNIHLFGRPGIAKTDLALFAHSICFKSAYIDVAKASSVGLTAAAIKDEFLKQWVLEAGALVLAGSGLAVLDELDKLKDETTANDLGEPMEKGTISIHKASIHDTLEVSARVLGIGNITESYSSGFVDSKVLRLPTHLIDRFDLLLKADNVDHVILAKKIILSSQEEDLEDNDFLKKYLFYVFNHKISKNIAPEVFAYLSDFISVVMVESSFKGFVVSPRFIQSLVRLTFASAKLRLAECVDLFDAKTSVSLMKRSFEDRGISFNEEKNLEVGDDEIVEHIKSHQGINSLDLQKKFSITYERLVDLRTKGLVFEKSPDRWGAI